MKTTLVIMAAGIGSRFGGGIKQLEPVGMNDEIIMDYSIHDAIEAGFNKIVFIIRKDIENDFKERIGNRIENVAKKANVEVAYCFQALDSLPSGYKVPEGRNKPWGTGQAVLAAKELVHEPFIVINADDYYGKQAFVSLHAFLEEGHDAYEFAMAGFILKNTLSDNGAVTRGICEVNGQGYLTDICETSNIIKTATGASVEGKDIDANSYCSMNTWALTPEFMNVLEEQFTGFLNNLSNPLKDEYLLPTIIGNLLDEKKATVKVLETKDKWFGVTYKEDKQTVVDSFKHLIETGVYKEDLYSDL